MYFFGLTPHIPAVRRDKPSIIWKIRNPKNSPLGSEQFLASSQSRLLFGNLCGSYSFGFFCGFTTQFLNGAAIKAEASPRPAVGFMFGAHRRARTEKVIQKL